ncbi:hypothetical protein O6H91_Y383300 [Diphasiastrum complanatum]|nr:hypothetical protein O6H91_Y383300 [Diphasiastrum complanatum]
MNISINFSGSFDISISFSGSFDKTKQNTQHTLNITTTIKAIKDWSTSVNNSIMPLILCDISQKRLYIPATFSGTQLHLEHMLHLKSQNNMFRKAPVFYL